MATEPRRDDNNNPLTQHNKHSTAGDSSCRVGNITLVLASLVFVSLSDDKVGSILHHSSRKGQVPLLSPDHSGFSPTSFTAKPDTPSF